MDWRACDPASQCLKLERFSMKLYHPYFTRKKNDVCIMMENFLFFPLKGWGWILFFYFLFYELCLRVVIINHMQVDENLQRQKEIDEWLPITSSRNAKWWYSAFHNVTAMVGAGVLGLPSAMASLGWYICLKQTQYSS